jgi:RimJ/RimL family protein N-acetyltransferase
MKKLVISLCTLIAGQTFCSHEPIFPITVRTSTPQALTLQEMQKHIRIASDSFYAYDTSIVADVGSKEFYDDYFEEFFELFMQQEEEEFFLFSAYDTQKTLVGGMYGRILTGPYKVLGLKQGQKAYCISCVYVDQPFQNKGIATTLVAELITLTQTSPLPIPIFLYTFATHTAARKIYKNCGFTLMTDKKHPNGEWTLAARALFFGDRCLITPVAYRKN